MNTSFPYKQDISHCLERHAGAEGVTDELLLTMKQRAEATMHHLQEHFRREEGGPLHVPFQDADFGEIEQLAGRIRREFRELVVIGTGGSSLGAKMLVELAAADSGPQITFLDNVDPHTMEQALKKDVEKRFYLVVSKSGGTVETISQGLVVIQALVERISRHAPASQMAVITMPSDSPLRAIAEQHQIPLIDHPSDVGGRFSVLTAVGLIPASVAGLDIRALRQGAVSVIRQWMQSSAPDEIPAMGGAIVACAMMEMNKKISVFMPYVDRLFHVGSWYRQLWAESLGKQGKGSVPVRALGTVDQHSQLQLYLDGPADKYYTVVTTKHAGKGPAVDLAYASNDARLDYLRGHRIGDVIQAEQQATIDTLKAAGRPVREIHLPVVDGYSVGALLMHFMLETVASAKLLGINPYDQPAVEDGKRRAKHMLAGDRTPEMA